MSNSRITKKERALLKGAIRRVFARSDLRREAMERLKLVNHYDEKHPRVKLWSVCPICKEKRPRYLFQVDHHVPVVPYHLSFEEMSLDEVVERTWCDPKNLRPMCKECHHMKTLRERKLRKSLKKST